MSQRNAVLLMLFPEQFEDISAREHKRRIAAAFPNESGDSSDIDRQILAIRQAKEEEFGADFSWYNPSIRSIWDKKAPKRQRQALRPLPWPKLTHRSGRSWIYACLTCLEWMFSRHSWPSTTVRRWFC